MRTITGTTGAWLPSYNTHADPSDVDNLFFASSDMTSCGWVKVGTASVTVELLSDTDLMTEQLAMLDEAERIASGSVKPIADIRSTAEYRAWVSGRLVRGFLEELLTP